MISLTVILENDLCVISSFNVAAKAFCIIRNFFVCYKRSFHFLHVKQAIWILRFRIRSMKCWQKVKDLF